MTAKENKARLLSEARNVPPADPINEILADRLRDAAARSFTVPEFCAIERMSQTTYYKLQKKGLGPDELRLEGMSFCRITNAARLEWHKKLEQHRKDKAAKLEAERAERSEIAARGGKPAHRDAKPKKAKAKAREAA